MIDYVYVEYMDEEKQQHLNLCRSCEHLNVDRCNKIDEIAIYDNVSTIFKCPENKW